ncbi:hypothetical protein JXA31_00515 [Candidatus Bathyarchaeota archaeon]|nr:hypothetical protein [Candidatus Bathyarchaeota archaeon]
MDETVFFSIAAPELPSYSTPLSTVILNLAIIATITGIGIGLLVYFDKRKH